MKKIITKNLITLITMILAGYLLLVLAYLLPVDLMEKNMIRSIGRLRQEGISNNLIEGYDTTRLDNYTEALTFNSAIYPGKESVFLKAAAVYQITYDTGNYYDALLRYADGDHNYTVGSYARDWHGYLVYIKPLLLIMDYNGICFFNLIVQLILIVLIIIFMFKNMIHRYISAYLLFLMFVGFPFVAHSMEYSALFTVTNIIILCVLALNDLFDANKSFSLIFMVTGAVVSYIDVLTYPIVTLGVPLVFCFLMNEKTVQSMKKTVLFIIEQSIWWLTGYAGMWGGKWLIASIVTKDNVLKEAILMALYRMSDNSFESGEGVTFGLIDVLRLNFGVFLKPIYLVMLGLFAAGIVITYIRCKISFKRNLFWAMMIISVMPLGWYVFIGNHSYVHFWMTHRNISVMVMALSTALISMAGIKKGDERSMYGVEDSVS